MRTSDRLDRYVRGREGPDSADTGTSPKKGGARIRHRPDTPAKADKLHLRFVDNRRPAGLCLVDQPDHPVTALLLEMLFP